MRFSAPVANTVVQPHARNFTDQHKTPRPTAPNARKDTSLTDSIRKQGWGISAANAILLASPSARRQLRRIFIAGSVPRGTLSSWIMREVKPVFAKSVLKDASTHAQRPLLDGIETAHLAMKDSTLKSPHTIHKFVECATSTVPPHVLTSLKPKRDMCPIAKSAKKEPNPTMLLVAESTATRSTATVTVTVMTIVPGTTFSSFASTSRQNALSNPRVTSAVLPFWRSPNSKLANRISLRTSRKMTTAKLRQSSRLIT
mmetsp:Transcript_10474/g.14811  ORF Transcript_10474/g.14811 Transcript_10474/m.14811 type:complete len:257 (-) Transcript_10474:96-866(-)